MRRSRRLAAALALLAPSLSILAFDLVHRRGLIAGFRGVSLVIHLATVLGSMLFWAVLLHIAAGRRGVTRHLGGAVFLVLFGFVFGVQNAFFSTYKAYVCIDQLIFSDDMWRAIVAAQPLAKPPLVAFLATGFALGAGMLWCARRFVRPRQTVRAWIPVLGIATVSAGFAAPVSAIAWVQVGSPDLLYFHGLAVLYNDRLRRKIWRQRPQMVRVQHRMPVAVPPLAARPPHKRNVVLILQEAQRADVTCIAYDPGCKLATRTSNLLLPRRFPFFQARAAASSTAASVAVLWSGLDVTETYENLHSAPLVWELARAAGYDTAYWTSQNLVYFNARLFVQDLPTSCAVHGTEIDPACNWLTGPSDDKLVDYVAADWPKLQEPFFAVVHLSNIHRPRVVDPARAPFAPSHTEDKGTGGAMGQNYYKNSVYLSDLAVARLIQHIRATEAGRRTVLVYTSDHGEAYGEHRNENDHSATVFDEEIRVPLWIDAPEGTLSADEVAGYSRNAAELVSQYDQSATLLDLLGVWDDPRLLPFRKRMLGGPIARPLRVQPVPLSNVSWVWEYHRPNWGMMLGPLKVLADVDDPAYKCFDLARDPAERHNLAGQVVCARLEAEAHLRFGMLPKDLRRLRDRPDWGRAGEPNRAGAGAR